jgi:hypothetical protein
MAKVEERNLQKTRSCLKPQRHPRRAGEGGLRLRSLPSETREIFCPALECIHPEAHPIRTAHWRGISCGLQCVPSKDAPLRCFEMELLSPPPPTPVLGTDAGGTSFQPGSCRDPRTDQGARRCQGPPHSRAGSDSGSLPPLNIYPLLFPPPDRTVAPHCRPSVRIASHPPVAMHCLPIVPVLLAKAVCKPPLPGSHNRRS